MYKDLNIVDSSIRILDTWNGYQVSVMKHMFAKKVFQQNHVSRKRTLWLETPNPCNELIKFALTSETHFLEKQLLSFCLDGTFRS